MENRDTNTTMGYELVGLESWTQFISVSPLQVCDFLKFMLDLATAAEYI